MLISMNVRNHFKKNYYGLHPVSVIKAAIIALAAGAITARNSGMLRPDQVAQINESLAIFGIER